MEERRHHGGTHRQTSLLGAHHLQAQRKSRHWNYRFTKCQDITSSDAVRGLYGNKKIKGRKQHVVVDTQDYLMAVSVHEANIHDRKGAPKVIQKLSCKFPGLIKILANGGYRGNLADWVLDKYRWEFEVVLGSNECSSSFLRMSIS